MKHKRHQKDRRDKSDKPSSRHDDHHYSLGPKQYKMKDLSENCGDENAPKKHFKFIILVTIAGRVSIAPKNILETKFMKTKGGSCANTHSSVMF